MPATTIAIVDPDAGKVVAEDEAAARCCLSTKHFRRLRSRGEGPRFVQLAERRVGYRRGDIDAWIEARLAGPGLDRRRRPEKTAA